MPVQRFNLTILVVTPALAVYGLLYVVPNMKTVIFAVLYYLFSMLGKRFRGHGHRI
jgi:stearoyl-CoA desaturase (delta-9 desaturase)